MDGLDRGLKAPDPMTLDLYGLTPLERTEMGISSLPHDLFEAVQIAEDSEFLKGVLGPEVHRKLVETKLMEVDEFRLHVSALDLEKHLVL